MPNTPRAFLTALLGAALACTGASAQAPKPAPTQQLLAQVRAHPGANHPDTALHSLSPVKAAMPWGDVVEVETGWYSYIGDTHLYFLNGPPERQQIVGKQELAKLGLTPDQALAISVENFRRICGPVHIAQRADGVLQMLCAAPEPDSTGNFLDQALWQSQAAERRDALVAALPQKGMLLFAPSLATKAVQGLRKQVAQTYSSAGTQRISAALYRFQDGKWSVLEAPR